MKDLRFFILGILMAVGLSVTAATVSYFGKGSADQLGASLATLIAGEDQTNDVIKVEGQFSYEAVTADNEIGSAAGFIHTISCATAAGAAATAGAITVYDNTAESGTEIVNIGIPASAFTPFTLVIDAVVSNGIYVGFDGTVAGVECSVSYR